MLCVVMSIFVASFVLLFFFKQKTAYEMRISDWSFRRVLFRSKPLGAFADDEGCLPFGAFFDGLLPGLYAAGDVVAGLDQISVAKIGRASCRERVCQYV